MAEQRILGNGPVEFTDSQGGQVSVPLSALRRDDQAGGIHLVGDDSNPWVAKLGADKAILDQLLSYFGKNQSLKAAPQAMPQSLLLVTAANPGPAGNDYSVEFKEFKLNDKGKDLPPEDVTFTVAVQEEHVWDGLTVGTIAAVLGTDKSQPPGAGIVHVKDGSVNADLFPDPDPKKATYPLTADGNNTPTADIKDPKGQTVFTLEARNRTDKATVTLSNVDAVAKTFTLDAVRTVEVTGVTLDTVETALPAGDLTIKRLLPAPAESILAEAAGDNRIRLAGGNSTVPAFAFAPARD